MIMEPSAKFKTTMCRHFEQKGFCSLYDKCYFAHSHQQLRNENDPLPENLPVQMKPISNYKTQLCKFYDRGYCKNNDECTYAHGDMDIRSMPVVPADSYKDAKVVAPPVQRVAPPLMAHPYMYMVPVMPVPIMNPNMHLLTILQNMYQVFPGNVLISKQLRRAEELFFKGDYTQAEGVLKEIINDSNRTEPQKDKLKTICQNAIYLNSLKSSAGYVYHPPQQPYYRS